jgi:antirestriction protein ArdC
MADETNLVTVAGFLQRHLETRRFGKYPRLLLRPKMDRALLLAMACGAEVKRGGWVPHYNIKTDEIILPPARWYRTWLMFKSPARFAADCCHELIHWASGPKRLNRLHAKEWGDAAYCRAELEAELGAVILCRELQVTNLTILPHARYLDHFVRGVGQPELELSAALVAANRASGYLLQLARDELV